MHNLDTLNGNLYFTFQNKLTIFLKFSVKELTKAFFIFSEIKTDDICYTDIQECFCTEQHLNSNRNTGSAYS